VNTAATGTASATARAWPSASSLRPSSSRTETRMRVPESLPRAHAMSSSGTSQVARPRVV
jgi:hypothetical protein